ncbi:MAG: SDR family oxidoreductase [Alphaproteobacteria bacterium]|nr:SDR family oxidoreductase [Alphaproteobacteria bacterium]
MAANKVALVTGAAGGMGMATVRRLVSDGFTVAAMDMNAKGLAELAKTLGASVSSWPCDQTNEAAVREAVKNILAKHGGVDALVNLTGWCGTTRFFEETSDYWSKVIAINFQALLYVTQPVLHHMIEKKRGKICFVASDAGRVGTSGEAVYAGMKGAVISFGKSLARENARHNICVNTMCPGPTDTPLLQEEIRENPDLIQRMVKIIPFRRVGQPDDMANAISFLCSKDSDYITGQTLSVSGGLTMV